ncbi:MAG: BatA domain-containing protein [Bryobacteraceae bacterium]
MGFLSPWFLAGLAAVGLPVWLHLLRKHRATPVPFSSLMFFERRAQSSLKHRRLRYLILFALRTLLFALLALAFAHPYLQRKLVPLSRSGEVTVLAIDNSLSMQAAGLLDRARNLAKAEVAGLRPGQRAQVLAFSSRVEVLSEVTGDRQALDAALDAIAPSDGRTSFAGLSRSLRSIAQSLRLPLRVLLYSDMQQSGMPVNFNDLRLNADIRLEPHPLVSKQTPNFTVENVVAPRRVYSGAKARVLATIAGFGTADAVRNASLTLNGRVIESKSVTVPASGRAAVEFNSLEVPYGRNRGEVKIDSADALAADDAFYFSVERADPRHALFVHDPDNTRDLLYFKTALEATGQSAFAIDPAAADQTANVAPSKYAFVVISDVGALPGSFEKSLRDYVRGGGSVLIALGRSSMGRSKVPVADLAIQGTRYAGREGDLFQSAEALDPSHPSIQQNNRWDDVKFFQAMRVDPGPARVVARLTDETPLLLDEQLGAGHILVFASTLDNVANDFPVHASFVPFIEQTANYLGHLDAGPPAVTVGSFEELRGAGEKATAVDVFDPKGERLFSLAEAATAQNIEFTADGFYDIRRPNGRNELVAVNADRRESDLAPAPPETLRLWQNTASGVAASGQAAAGQSRLSLWWYVMLAVLACAIAESLLGNRHLSVDKEAP